MAKTAIILGATGLTGSILLEKLIKDQRYKTIKLFSRKKIEGLPSKVEQFVGNMLKLETFKEVFTGNEVYCCIGTTAKKTPDKKAYKKIDFGIPTTAAKLSKENNINTFLVISAMGANEKSSIFYNKTKGEMEIGVMQQNIPNTYILRPSIIGGDRKENRPLEKLGLAIFKLIQPIFIGGLKKYRIIEAKNIAQAMINLANSEHSSQQLFTSDEIQKISEKQALKKLK